jgi:hypothetical protein
MYPLVVPSYGCPNYLLLTEVALDFFLFTLFAQRHVSSFWCCFRTWFFRTWFFRTRFFRTRCFRHAKRMPEWYCDWQIISSLVSLVPVDKSVHPKPEDNSPLLLQLKKILRALGVTLFHNNCLFFFKFLHLEPLPGIG